MKIGASLLLVLLAGHSARAQDKDKHVIRASAEATVTAEPNQAHISIGVQTQAPNARASAEQNAAKTDALLKAMKTVLRSKGQIQTSGYSISPYYQTIDNNNRQAGFETTNTVEVTLDDLSLLPDLIDASAASGANNVGGISLGLKDDTAARTQALGDASKQARAAGEAMAQALGLNVTAVLGAESNLAGGGPVRPVMDAMAFRAAKTPIETGKVSVHANVTVTLEGRPKTGAVQNEWMKESIFPPKPKVAGPYSPAVRAGGFVFFSGQIPADPDTGDLVTGDIQTQCRRVLDNLKLVLAAAGLTLEDVVKTNVFLKDMNNFARMNEAYSSYFPNNPPARTTVEVARLPKDVGIEIEMIALDKK